MKRTSYQGKRTLTGRNHYLQDVGPTDPSNRWDVLRHNRHLPRITPTTLTSKFKFPSLLSFLGLSQIFYEVSTRTSKQIKLKFY